MKLVFLLEEESTKHLLDSLLPKILPEEVTFQTIAHEGKRDLQKSIPRKLRGVERTGRYSVCDFAGSRQQRLCAIKTFSVVFV